MANFVYSEKDPSRLSNLFSVQIFCMKAFGLMDPKFQNMLPSSWNVFGIAASQMYWIFVLFLPLHLAVSFGVSAFHFVYYGGLEEITDSLTMLIIYSFASFAIVYWKFHWRNLDVFFDSVNKHHEHHSLPGLTFVNVRRSSEIASKETIFWMIAGISGTIFWAAAPIILRQRVLPVKCWYPFNTKQVFVYEVTYFVQFLAQCEMGAAFANGSAQFVSIVLIMLGQFDVLFCSLKNIYSHSALLAGQNLESMSQKQSIISIHEEEQNQYVICEEYKTNLEFYLSLNKQAKNVNLQQALQYSMKRCILHHQFILKSCAKFEELFHPYCLIKSLQITIQLCLLVFSSVVGERSIIRSLNLVGYLFLTSGELVMFTYCGEVLRSHSLRAGEALLRSPWHKNMPLIKREVLIFLANTKKPVQLTAGKFFVMNVDRLRSVVMQAFSFLTLLQKLAAKK